MASLRNLTYEDMNYFKKRPATGRHPHMQREGTVLSDKDTDDVRLVGGYLWKGCIGVHSDALVDKYQRELYTTVHHMAEDKVEEELRSLGHEHNCITVLSPEQNFGIVIMLIEGETIAALGQKTSPFSDHMERTYYIVWRRKSGIYAVVPDVIQRDLLVEGMGLALEERTGKTRVRTNFFVDQGIIYPFVSRSLWEKELCSKDGKKRSGLSKAMDANRLYFSVRHQQSSSSSSYTNSTGGSSDKSVWGSDIFRTRVQTTMTSAFQRQQLHSTRSTSEPTLISEDQDQDQPEVADITIMDEEVEWNGSTYTHHPSEDEENMWYDEKGIWFKRNEDGSFEKRHEFYDDDEDDTGGEDAEEVSEVWKGTKYIHGPTEDEENMWYDEKGIWFKRKKNGSFEKRWEFYPDEDRDEEEREEAIKLATELIDEYERNQDPDFDPDASELVDDMEVSDSEARAEEEAVTSEEDSSSEDEKTKIMSDLKDMQEDLTFDRELGRNLTREEEEERLREEEAEFLVSDKEALQEVKRAQKRGRKKEKKIMKQKQKKQKKPVLDDSSESDSDPFTESSSSSDGDSSSNDEDEPKAFKMEQLELDKKQRSKARRQSIKKKKIAERKSLEEENKRLNALQEEVDRMTAEAKKINKEAKAADKKRKAAAAQKQKADAAAYKNKFYLCVQGMSLKEAVNSQQEFMEETKRVSEFIDHLSGPAKRDLCYSILGSCHPEQMWAIRTLLEDFADFGPQIAYKTIAPKHNTVSEMRRVRLQAALALLGGSRLGGDCKTTPIPKKQRVWHLDPDAVPDFISDRFVDSEADSSEKV